MSVLFPTLLVECRLRQGRVTGVTVTPRPLPPVFALLNGKTPEHALRTIATVFGLCRSAQCHAAAEALARASDTPLDSGWRLLQRALRDLEMVREHSLNLLRLPDWPSPGGGLAADLLSTARNLGEALAGREIAAAFAADGTTVAIDVPRVRENRAKLWRIIAELLGEAWLHPRRPDCAGLTERTTPAGVYLNDLLCRGEAGWGQCRVPLLRTPLPAAELAVVLNSGRAERFVSRPDWAGSVRETTGYGRQYRHPLLKRLSVTHGNGLLPRVAGRCLEIGALLRGLNRTLAVLTDHPRIVKPSPRAESGWGIAQVRTARGLLIHAARLQGGRIAAYRVVAPTEWNFHPAGLLAEAVTGHAVADETGFRRCFTTFLYAVDPCIDFDLRLLQA
jgi:hypothetical protein